MPQLTDRFGPIPSQVVLDGAGGGNLTFQPNGSNARITNLYVKTSTSVKQAVCTIYKGQIASSNIIDSTNSGSTGASAKGAIDLMDGETLFVVWTGGDAGATAFATFTGIAIPFNQVGPSGIVWADPIAAGDGTLIYPALQSNNFVAGTSGWQITRAGNAEFNDVTVRGTIFISGSGDSFIHLWNPSGTPVIQQMPNDLGSTHPGTSNPSVISASQIDSTNEIYALTLQSPFTSNVPLASTVALESGSYNGVIPAQVRIGPSLVGTDNFTYVRGQSGTVSFAIAGGNTNQAVTFATAFPGGVTPIVLTNLSSGAAGSVSFVSRALSITNAGFSANVNGTFSVGFTASVQWFAFAPV